MKKDHQLEYSYGFGTVVELKDKYRRTKRGILWPQLQNAKAWTDFIARRF